MDRTVVGETITEASSSIASRDNNDTIAFVWVALCFANEKQLASESYMQLDHYISFGSSLHQA